MSPGTAAQVRLCNFRVSGDLLGGTFGNLDAKLDAGEPVAKAHDDLHDVLDHED